MPIPPFRADGYLPEGLHIASLEETSTRFGQVTARRRHLLIRVEEWVTLARAVGAPRLLVDGSFVTVKARPGDVDAVVWLPADFEDQVDARRPDALQLALMLESGHPREIFPAADSGEWEGWVRFFSQTRERDRRRKGIVEVQL